MPEPRRRRVSARTGSPRGGLGHTGFPGGTLRGAHGTAEAGPVLGLTRSPPSPPSPAAFAARLPGRDGAGLRGAAQPGELFIQPAFLERLLCVRLGVRGTPTASLAAREVPRLSRTRPRPTLESAAPGTTQRPGSAAREDVGPEALGTLHQAAPGPLVPVPTKSAAVSLLLQAGFALISKSGHSPSSVGPCSPIAHL